MVYAYSAINTGRSKKHTRLVFSEAILATLSHTSTSSQGTWGNSNFVVVLVLSKEHQYKVLYISLPSYQPKISLKPPTAPRHKLLLYWCPDRAHSRRVFNNLSIHTITTKTTRRYVYCDEPFFLRLKGRPIIRLFQWMVHWWWVLLCHINPKSSGQQGIFVY
jgi:hypothetical protein